MASDLVLFCPAVLDGEFGSPEAALLHIGYSPELARRILGDANERDPMWSDQRTGARLAEPFLTPAQEAHADMVWTEPCEWHGIVLHRKTDGCTSLWSADLGDAASDRDSIERLASTLTNLLQLTVRVFEWRETSSFLWDAECAERGVLQ